MNFNVYLNWKMQYTGTKKVKWFNPWRVECLFYGNKNISLRFLSYLDTEIEEVVKIQSILVSVPDELSDPCLTQTWAALF